MHPEDGEFQEMLRPGRREPGSPSAEFPLNSPPPFCPTPWIWH